MYIILVYDINQKRVGKVLKKCREYLYWVQNSVLEGEISQANFKRMKLELSAIINPKEDSVIIYNLRTTRYYKREIMGVEKGGVEKFL